MNLINDLKRKRVATEKDKMIMKILQKFIASQLAELSYQELSKKKKDDEDAESMKDPKPKPSYDSKSNKDEKKIEKKDDKLTRMMMISKEEGIQKKRKIAYNHIGFCSYANIRTSCSQS